MICPRCPAAPRFETLLPCRAWRGMGARGDRAPSMLGKAVSDQGIRGEEAGVSEGQLEPAGQGSRPLGSPPDPQGAHDRPQAPCRAQPDGAPGTCRKLSAQAVLSTGAPGLPAACSRGRTVTGGDAPHPQPPRHLGCRSKSGMLGRVQEKPRRGETRRCGGWTRGEQIFSWL